MPHDSLHAAKDEFKDVWLRIDGVEAVGVRDDHLIVNLSDAAAAGEIPNAVKGGITVKTEVTGGFDIDFPALPVSGDDQTAYRPVIGGVSIGHEDIGYGSSGVMAVDPDTGDEYILSNNHVLANVNRGDIGDAINQPGSSTRAPGELAGYVTLEDGVTVDVAWADITHEDGIDPTINNLETPDEPVGIRIPSVGDTITKSGARTGVTTGDVRQLDTAVNVGFGDDIRYRMEHCVIADKYSDGGDSGSAVINPDDGSIAGIHFASGSSVSVFCAADQVEQETGLKLRRVRHNTETPQDRIDDLEAKITELEGKIDDYETRTEAISEMVSQGETHVTALQSALDDIRNQL